LFDKIILMKTFQKKINKLSIIFLAPFVLFAPIYAIGHAMFWGTPAMQFVPWREYAWELIKIGQIPLWNSLVGMGAPLLANYQSAIFYPPNWMQFIFYELGGRGGLAWAQAPLVAAHLAFAGFGMAYLARRLGMNIMSQVIAGLAFGLSGYLVARAGFLIINATVAWLPWIFGISTNIVFKILSSRGNSNQDMNFEPQSFLRYFSQVLFSVNIEIIKLTFLVAMMLFAGHAQTAWYSILLLIIWCGYLVLSQPKGSDENNGVSSRQNGGFGYRSRLYSLGMVLVILVISLGVAICLTSVQLIPTIEYLLESQRSTEVDFEFGLTYSFWPWRFLSLIAPDMFGNPVHGDYWGYANYWEDAVYIGLLPIILALIAIVNGVKGNMGDSWNHSNNKSDLLVNRPKLIRFMVGIIILSFLLALGKNTPLFPWLYRHIPTFDMFNAPTRFSLWAVFLLALLAGIGVEYWNRPEKKGLYWTRLGTAGAFAVMLGAGLAWILMGDISPSFIRATALTGAGLVVIGGLSLTAPKRMDNDPHNMDQNGQVWAWIVVILVAVDLVITGWGLNPGIDIEFYQSESPTTSRIRELVDDGRLFLPFEDEYSLKFSRFFMFDSFYPVEDWFNLRAVQLPNIAMYDDLNSANNFDPIVPGRYAVWLERFRESNPETQSQMLNLMSVKVLEQLDSTELYGIKFIPVPSFDIIRWVPCGIEASGGENAFELLLSGNINLREEVVLEDVHPIFSSQCSRNSQGVIDFISEEPGNMQLSFKAEDAGYVVISNVWYPGWKAELDGQPTEVIRANYLFTAVSVPAGNHELRLEYRPASFFVGAMVSFISIIGVLIATLIVFKKRRKQETEKYK
jgi:hypothetical protein